LTPEIQLLINLQELELKIRDLRQQLEEIPQQEEEINSRKSQLKTLLETAENCPKEMEKQLRGHEQDMKDLEEQQQKLRQKQIAIKNNQVYQACLAEIDYLKKQISQKEDNLLELMEAIDNARNEAKTAREKFDKESVKLGAEEKNLKDSTTFLNSEIERLNSQREQLIMGIPRPLLELYNKLAGSLGGVAVTEARNELCLTCHVRLRPQFFQELRVADDVRQCENCSRILYTT
jgi:predicted  nucleic acid-binding Zn-ribbon protein